MSLVLIWFGNDFIVAASDGRLAQKHADGSVTPIAEDFSKIHKLTDEAALIVVGDSDLGLQLLQMLGRAMSDLSASSMRRR